MVDFRKMTSPRSRREWASLQEEIDAAKQKDTPALAAWILDLSRTLRNSGKFNADPTYSYDEWALYRVIPELARRLDPQIVLRPDEIPDASKEGQDRLTWVKDATSERFAEMIDSILANASFRRGIDFSFDASDRAARMLHFFRGSENPIRITLDRLSGKVPEIKVQETQPPLTGFYLIGEKQKRDTVLFYGETAAETVHAWDAVRASIDGLDLSDDQKKMVEQIRRYRSDKLEDHDQISIQDFDGNRIPIEDLKSTMTSAPVL